MGQHIIVEPETGHTIIKKYLSNLGVERPLTLYIPHFSVLSEIIRSPALLLTPPNRFAIMLAQKYNLQ